MQTSKPSSKDSSEADRYESLLEHVAGIAQTLGTARDLLTVYRALRAFAFATTPANAIFISLYDPERHQRTAAYSAGPNEEDDVSTLPSMPITSSPSSRAVLSGEPVIVEDFQKEMIGQPLLMLGMESDPDEPRSSLSVPMAVMGRVVGAVEAQSTRLAAFGPEHATAMRMAGNLAAIAIENVRMLEREAEREAELRQSQKMEAVGRLAGGVAHDFNNLLTVINGYTDIIARHLPVTDPLQNYVREVRKAGDRAATLTRQLLAFSRKQVLQPKVIDINDVVRGLEGMLKRLIGEDVAIETDLEPSIGPILADPGQVEQVILNLAVNARDAMPHGGTLRLATANQEPGVAACGLLHCGTLVELRVLDTGVGMDVETQARIFEPFFTTKEPGKGTGLGLSTVYGIVKQSGGCITVASAPGQGTTFGLHFPHALAASRESAGAVAADAAGGTGSGTVLLVEDEESVRRLAREILQDQAFKVLEAATGPEGLDVAERYDGVIDILLTDVVMPGMNGKELADRIAAIRPDMKIIFMSGYTEEAIGRHGVLEHGMEFLEKPFTPGALVSMVTRSLARGGGSQ